MRPPLGLAPRRVATQRQHVLDPGVGEAVEDHAQLVAGRADAAQMRHRLDAELLLDPFGELERQAARRAGRSVRHRHEIGLELAQRPERLAQVALALVGLGREELEREDRLLGRGEDLIDPHRRGTIATLTRLVSRFTLEITSHVARSPSDSRAIRP